MVQKLIFFWMSFAKKHCENDGIPYGIRTRVAAVKGRHIVQENSQIIFYIVDIKPIYIIALHSKSLEIIIQIGSILAHWLRNGKIW
ncbi:hypothetical protein HK12_08450 [Acetobacter orientalis]|uniref:Uncharacterized protein n=1 Tax=Acetobacter orientalis TaxID=146474 RepID=A0A252A0B2_9PROT|nr:hypothetical protein HK12_08450 [Acetobacter orientalis]